MLEAFIDIPNDKKLSKEGERKSLTDIRSKDIHKIDKNSHEILKITTETNNEIRRLINIYLSHDLSTEENKLLALNRVKNEIRIKYKNVESDIRGIESSFRVAVYYLEKMKVESESITSNDYLDAFSKIDLVRLVYDKDTEKISETYFIQVKSREMKTEEELNKIISNKVNVIDTEFNENDKYYLSKAQEMYKQLEDEILREKGKFYLDEEDRAKIFKKIKESKIRDRRGMALNRPDTKESIYHSYKTLISKSKEINKKQIDINRENREALEQKMSEKRLEIIKDIVKKIFKSKSLMENLDKEDEVYLGILGKMILNIFEPKDKVKIIENLVSYYEIYSLKEWGIDSKEEFSVLLDMSKEELEKAYEYLLSNLEEIKRIVNAKAIEEEEVNKANIINSDRFYAVIAYVDNRGDIREEVKEII